MAGDCVFCSIVAGTAPAERVYEDDAAVAILDLHPAAAGHVLVLPRRHARDLWHIRREEAAATMAAAVAVAGLLRRALDPTGISLLHATGAAAWQEVPHFHLHLVPRHQGDRLVPPWPLDLPRADEASLRAVAAALRAAAPADD